MTTMSKVLYVTALMIGIYGTALHQFIPTPSPKLDKYFYGLCTFGLLLIPATFIHLLLQAWGKI